MHLDVFHLATLLRGLYPGVRLLAAFAACRPTSGMAADACRAATLTHNPLLLC